MKSIIFALFCLLGVAFASLGIPAPETFDNCATPIPAPSYRGDNDSARDLYTPDLCVDPIWGVPVPTLDLDHIVLDIRFHRYLVVQNISGGVNGDFPLYGGSGGCENTPSKADFQVTSDADYYYIRARIAFAALKWAGCTFQPGNTIYCVFWMNMIEHFKLGGVPLVQTQKVRWPLYITLPNTLKAQATIKVYPVASFQAAILVFHEYPYPDYSVRVVFLVMVSKPYAATGAYLIPAPYVEGWAVPGLQDLDQLDDHTSSCVDYGTDYCYQQIYVDLVPTNPCGPEDDPTSRNNYNGEYTLAGYTACMEGAECTLTPVHQEWMDWSFTFVFDTNDLCPTYLSYTVKDKIAGRINTYTDCTFATPEHVFTADQPVCAKIWVDYIDPKFPFIIKSIFTTGLSIGVSYEDVESDYVYYSLFPVLDPVLDNAKIQFSGITQVNITWDYGVTPPTHTEAYEYFSMILASTESKLKLDLPPPTLRHYIFNATLDAYYDWDYALVVGKKADLASMQEHMTNVAALTVSLAIPNGISTVVPPAVSSPVAASESTGLIAGVTVGAVALVAAVAVGAVIIRKRRAHYAEQKDSA